MAMRRIFMRPALKQMGSRELDLGFKFSVFHCYLS